MATSQIQELLATARPRAGKGAARAVRREGKVPAVIYGNKETPETIAVDNNELTRLLRRGHFMSSVFDIKLDGRTVRALPRDIQFDPVKDFPIHVDFQRVAADGRIRIAIPVEIINEDKSPGMKRGGVLNMVRHEIEVFCPADRIPATLEIDLAGVEIGTSIHISAIALPEGVTPTITDRDFTVITVAGSAAAKSDANAADNDDKADGA
ncbi:MAG: 50S ribosomal protein L25/general stress protein Ctc [Hyphomicrobiaceae bacterium]|nr:50S ribosomal protein L25/general stress protein Ctc [Hyphomicrobiaceae bacterium]